MDRFCSLRKTKQPQITFLNINPFTAESDCLKAPLVTNEWKSGHNRVQSDLKRIVGNKDCQVSHWVHLSKKKKTMKTAMYYDFH